MTAEPTTRGSLQSGSGSQARLPAAYAEASRPESLSGGQRRLPRNLQFWAGLAIVGLTVAVAALAPVLATHDPLVQDIVNRNATMSSEHWLGLDDLGRDMYSRLVWGARVTLSTALLSIALALPLGGLLGAWAGLLRGPFDALTMRFLDVQLAYPGLLRAMVMIVTLGASQRSVVLALALGYVPYFARLVRGAVLHEATLDYVLAAEALGQTRGRVLLRHIGPNVLGLALVHGSFAVSGAMVAEASLSFLGLGVSPSEPSWGRMLSNGTQIIYIAPHVAVVPIVALSAVIFGWFLLGEGSRELLDPRRRA